MIWSGQQFKTEIYIAINNNFLHSLSPFSSLFVLVVCSGQFNTEVELIQARTVFFELAIFPERQTVSRLTTCPRRRSCHGIDWKTSRTLKQCCVPKVIRTGSDDPLTYACQNWCPPRSKVLLQHSQKILESTGILIQVGQGSNNIPNSCFMFLHTKQEYLCLYILYISKTKNIIGHFV